MLLALRQVGSALRSAAGAQEGGDIGGGGGRVESDGEVVGLKYGVRRRARRFKEASQRPEGSAEASSRDLELAVWPEQFEEEFAGMHLMAVVGQVGEERGGLPGAEARDHLVCALEAQSAEQSDVPRFCQRHRSPWDRREVPCLTAAGRACLCIPAAAATIIANRPGKVQSLAQRREETGSVTG
jgi:hypothetical protein